MQKTLPFLFALVIKKYHLPIFNETLGLKDVIWL